MNIIIAFPKIENGRKIRGILLRNGFEAHTVCTTGAGALQAAHQLSEGIVLCGPRLPDMAYTQLQECLPQGFEMLLAASASVCEGREAEGIVCLQMPLRVHELVETLHMMSGSFSHKGRKKARHGRTKEEERLLCEAKSLLMERNHLTEEEAHRYLQKRSMECGVGIVETAHMVLCLMKG